MYGYEPFENHFVQVVDYAEKLADELGGDKEIILIAAWLHDIGSIIHGRKEHHVTGAQIADQKLQELNYPAAKIELVKKCIFNHRGSRDDERVTLEEQIIAEADAMSNFDNIPGIFHASFTYENLTQVEAKRAVWKKLRNKWKKLHFDASKNLMRPKYEAVKLLFGKEKPSDE